MRAICLSAIATIAVLVSFAPTFGQSAPIAAASESSIPTTGEMPPDVEECIRDNAPKVEPQFDSLKDGVDFLTNYVCAGPIADEQRRQQVSAQEALRTLWQKQCDAKNLQGAQSNDKAVFDPCALAKTTVATGPLSALYLNTSFNRPAYATSLAAELLLDLRAGRKHSREH